MNQTNIQDILNFFQVHLMINPIKRCLSQKTIHILLLKALYFLDFHINTSHLSLYQETLQYNFYIFSEQFSYEEYLLMQFYDLETGKIIILFTIQITILFYHLYYYYYQKNPYSKNYVMFMFYQKIYNIIYFKFYVFKLFGEVYIPL